MNDGGEVEGKKNEHDKHPSSGDFSRTIARIAVAQVCDSIGFDTFHESALDSLADIAIRFICDLGKSSRFYANLAGRTESNVFDIIQGLDDLGIPQDFPHSNSVVSSGTIRALTMFIETADEIPFAQSLPKFPVRRVPKLIPSFLQIGETPTSKHIPPWLPAFPDPHTYIRTPVWNERATDPRTDKIELARQHRKAERSLLNLQRRLLSNGSQETPSSSSLPNDDDDDVPNGLDTEKEKKNDEKRVTLLDAFGPALDAMRDKVDPGSDGERANPSRKKSVFWEVKSSKKMLCEPLDLRFRTKTEPWFGRVDEKDDKKRRVELILRQSKQNQQELPQM